MWCDTELNSDAFPFFFLCTVCLQVGCRRRAAGLRLTGFGEVDDPSILSNYGEDDDTSMLSK